MIVGYLETLVDFAHSELSSSELERLWGRGATDNQIELYQVGCLYDSLPDLGPTAEKFMAWSDGGRKVTNTFTLPMTNILGQVKGIQFRHIEKSGYSDFWEDDADISLFGLGQAATHLWTLDQVWLVEGAFDLFPIQRTHPNVFATMTAAAPQRLVRFLARLVNEVVLAWDLDSAGNQASLDFRKYHANKFTSVLRPKLTPVPYLGQRQTKDPGEVWEMLGEVEFQRDLARALSRCTF